MGADAPFGNDLSKIDRYRDFWDRADVSRPLVGFTFRGWYPKLEYAASAAWQSNETLSPDMLQPAAFMEDEEKLLREGEIMDDDILRGACPSTAIRWLPAMLGNRLKILSESILNDEQTLSWDALENVVLDRGHPWYRKYIEYIDTLVERSAGRFPVSHGILLGPSDLAAALRGTTQSILDLLDKPQRVSRVLGQLGDVFREIHEDAWDRIPLFSGGYFDAGYQLWAPEPIIRLQEDATSLYSPELYRRLLLPVDRELAKAYPCSFIHLHSTSMFILDAFLEIDEIRCFQINNDVNGPPMKEIVPYFQRVQRAERPLLVRGSIAPDEARLLMDSLDPRGLYLHIMIEDGLEAEALRPMLAM